MQSTSSKRGRPVARYRCKDGTEIQGLTRFTDGRWKICATGKTFVEPDEFLAVARFRKWEGTQNASNVGTIKVHTSPLDALRDMTTRTIDAGGLLRVDITAAINGSGAYAVSDDVLTLNQWRWLREQIIARPKWVSEQVGIEQLSYLTDLKKPVPSETMESIIDVYTAKPDVTAEEKSRCRKFWNDFTTTCGIKTIRELNRTHVEKYEKALSDSDYSPKSIKHRHTGIRTVIAYALRRGRGVDDCRKALDLLAMLESPNSNPLDPKPIDTADFVKILAASKKANDKVFSGLLLFAINAALYATEVGQVKWTDVDLARGEFATRRNKTGVPRIAVLWPETLQAIKDLPKTRATIFNTRIQKYDRFSIHRDWNKHRLAAGVGECTFGQIRDYSFTIACRTSLDQARLLAGHRVSGSVDNYLLRQPQAVSIACQAIHDHLFAAAKVK